MKKRIRGSKDPLVIDPDFMEALDENESGSSRGSSHRQVERKTQQFCRQVQRALNFALADRVLCEGIDRVFVEEVSPAPDCGRLLVHVLVAGELPLADVLAALAREAPQLRSEVASAITRKRAPELCFVPANLDGSVDDYE